MISAKVIAHSNSAAGKEIISLQLHYPKFIHGEFMTHRAFSRNASSSRAIPVEKIIADIEADTAMPIYWGKNQPGMQAKEEHNEKLELLTSKFRGRPTLTYFSREQAWLEARDRALEVAKGFDKAGYHKQIVNRLLEPFYNINVLVTATEWDNFFELRCHPDAQPEMFELAWKIRSAIDESTPNLLEKGEWHLPYVNVTERHIYPLTDLIKISVARCARVSYKTHDDKEPEFTKDLILYDRLVGSRPLHASPAEHQARPREIGKDSFELCGNFQGWVQYRKTLESDLNP